MLQNSPLSESWRSLSSHSNFLSLGSAGGTKKKQQTKTNWEEGRPSRQVGGWPPIFIWGQWPLCAWLCYLQTKERAKMLEAVQVPSHLSSSPSSVSHSLRTKGNSHLWTAPPFLKHLAYFSVFKGLAKICGLTRCWWWDCFGFTLSTRLEEGFLCYFTQEQPRPITAPYTSVMGSVRILILMPIGSPLGKKGHCACHKYYFSLGLTHSKQSWSCLSLQPDQTICRTLGMNWR